MNDDSRGPPRICRVSSALYCTSSKNINLLFPLFSQDTSSRDDIQTVLPWLVPSRLSDILMRWDLAGSQCKCHSVSLTLPSSLVPFLPSFLVVPSFRAAFRIRDGSDPSHPPLRFSLSLSCSLFWFACYKIESSKKMDRWSHDFLHRLLGHVVN